MLLLASLFTQWGYDRTAQPARALSAWEVYQRTDLIIAALAVVALAASLFAQRRLHVALRVGAALAAAAMVWHTYRTGAPGLGAKVALLAVGVIGVASLPDLLPGRVPRRALGDDATARARALALSTPVIAALVTVVTYPPTTPEGPGTGFDESWIVGLHEAVLRGLSFGGEVVFTYGPLGFLTVPRAIEPWTFRLGVAYTLLAQFAVALAVLAAARRWAGLPLAAALAVVALSAVGYGTAGVEWQFPLAVVAAAAALACLAAPVAGTERRRLALVAAFGALAGVHSLVKLNSGLTIALLGLVAAVALVPERRLRALGAYAGAALAALVVCWLALGQALDDLPLYVVRGADVITGFAGALSREDPGREWEYLLALAVVAVLSYGAVATTRGWSRVRRAGALVVVALLAFSLFKQGFVRHDAHASTFFAGAALLALVLPWARARRVDAVLAFGVLLVAWAASVNVLPRALLHPASSVRALEDRAGKAIDPGAAIAAGREGLRSVLALDDGVAAELRDRTFHVYPAETSFVPLIEGEWRPLPVFQSYQAYTPRLTGANAALLRGDRAPERILRVGAPADIEDPEARIEIACRYAERLRAPGDQQLLVRTPSRCGRDRLLARTEAATGRPVTVPPAAPDELVYVRIHGLEPSLWERLRSLVWKPYGYGLREGDRQPRLAPALAASRILLAIPPRYDYDAPYPLGSPVRELTVTAATQGVTGPSKPVRRDLTLEFHAVQLGRPAMEGRT